MNPPPQRKDRRCRASRSPLANHATPSARDLFSHRALRAQPIAGVHAPTRHWRQSPVTNCDVRGPAIVDRLDALRGRLRTAACACGSLCAGVVSVNGESLVVEEAQLRFGGSILADQPSSFAVGGDHVVATESWWGGCEPRLDGRLARWVARRYRLGQ